MKVMINSNDPAMPIQYDEEYGDHGRKINRVFEGLTIRQHFAAMAMQGLCASGFFTDATLQKEAEETGNNVSVAIAFASVDLADELIKALNI